MTLAGDGLEKRKIVNGLRSVDDDPTHIAVPNTEIRSVPYAPSFAGEEDITVLAMRPVQAPDIS